MSKGVYLSQEKRKKDLIRRKKILKGGYGEYQDDQDMNNTISREE